jgi:hypothetical protein
MGSIMMKLIESKIDHWYKAFILWGYDWKRRQWMSQNQTVTEWQDPWSGLWYQEKTAMKLLEKQLLALLDVK